MNVSLCMIVLNGADSIEEVIESALPICDEIVVVDSGSTDGTQSIVKNRFNIDVINYPYPHSIEEGIAKIRAFSLNQVKTEWALVLDADEVLTSAPKPLNLHKLKKDVGGLFGTWINQRNGMTYLDYKMFLINVRNGVRFHGLVHASPQPSVRELGNTAFMCHDLTVTHKQKFSGYRKHYVDQMRFATAAYPHYIRYHWFLGYTLLQMGQDSGAFWLSLAANSNTSIFPVEKLNANLTLAEHFISKGLMSKAEQLLLQAHRYFSEVRDDFEVAINNYPVWIASLENALSGFQLHRRKFAC